MFLFTNLLFCQLNQNNYYAHYHKQVVFDSTAFIPYAHIIGDFFYIKIFDNFLLTDIHETIEDYKINNYDYKPIIPKTHEEKSAEEIKIFNSRYEPLPHPFCLPNIYCFYFNNKIEAGFIKSHKIKKVNIYYTDEIDIKYKNNFYNKLTKKIDKLSKLKEVYDFDENGYLQHYIYYESPIFFSEYSISRLDSMLIVSYSEINQNIEIQSSSDTIIYNKKGNIIYNWK